MNHILRPIFCGLLLSLLPEWTASAQAIRSSSYQTVAHIKSDGTIQDASYRTISQIKSEGSVLDTYYRIIGHLRRDETYCIVGHIRDDGTIQDSFTGSSGMPMEFR